MCILLLLANISVKTGFDVLCKVENLHFGL